MWYKDTTDDVDAYYSGYTVGVVLLRHGKVLQELYTLQFDQDESSIASKANRAFFLIKLQYTLKSQLYLSPCLDEISGPSTFTALLKLVPNMLIDCMVCHLN